MDEHGENLSKNYLNHIKILTDLDDFLKSPTPNDEAVLGTYRKTLLNFSELLKLIDDSSIISIQKNIFLAIIFERMNNHKESEIYWHKVKSAAQDIIDKSNYGLGLSYYSMNSLHKSLDYFSAISNRFNDIKSVNSKIKSIKVRNEINSSIDLFKSIIDLTFNKAPSSEVNPLIHEAIKISNLPYNGDKRIKSLIERAYSIISRYPDVGIDEHPHDKFKNYIDLRTNREHPYEIPKIIFTSGFLWSGSGAVTAMLSGIPGVDIAVGGREISLFHHANTLMGLVDKPRGTIGRRELMFLILSPVCGFFVDKSKVTVNRNKSLIKAQHDSGGEITKLLEASDKFISNIEKSSSSDDPNWFTLLAIRDFARDAVLSLAKDRNSTVLLNNSIFAFHARQMAFFPDAMSITVRRDPRDQYVAQFLERRRADLPSPESFVKDTRRRYDDHDNAISKVNLSDRIIPINFEDFVLKEICRKNILDRLNIKNFSLKNSSFDPMNSAKNIGIYKNFHDKKVISLIEEGFSLR